MLTGYMHVTNSLFKCLKTAVKYQWYSPLPPNLIYGSVRKRWLINGSYFINIMGIFYKNKAKNGLNERKKYYFLFVKIKIIKYAFWHLEN